MKLKANWYFDVVSPYAYLQAQRFGDLTSQLDITPVPVLFAGLLGAWGQLGPAEIPAKRIQTYRYAHWLAHQRGVPFRAPPRHPFNPLAILRLTIAASSTKEAALCALDHIWGKGEDGEALESLVPLATSLGIDNLHEAINNPIVKAKLRQNTEEAVSAGVYGVPTFQVGDALFWGDDLTDMMLDWLEHPQMLSHGEYKRHEELPTASVRTQSHV